MGVIKRKRGARERRLAAFVGLARSCNIVKRVWMRSRDDKQRPEPKIRCRPGPANLTGEKPLRSVQTTAVEVTGMWTGSRVGVTDEMVSVSMRRRLRMSRYERAAVVVHVLWLAGRDRHWNAGAKKLILT